MARAAPKWVVRCGCTLAVAWPLSIHGAVLRYRHYRSAGLFARK